MEEEQGVDNPELDFEEILKQQTGNIELKEDSSRRKM